jgi:iron(III) transport system permease protein
MNASSAGQTAIDGGASLPRPGVALYRRLGVNPKVFVYLLFAVVAIVVVYPLAVLLMASFHLGQPGRMGAFTLRYYDVLLRAGDLLPLLLHSVIFSGARLGVGLILGLMFAWAVARTNVPFRGAMAWLIPIPFFMPDLLSGLSWLMLGNPQNGLINQAARGLFGIEGNVINLYGWFGLIFHASLGSISFIFIMLVGFFKNMDTSYEEAANVHGASRIGTILTITLPLLAPAILSISILVFVHGLESFENPLLFGNPGGVYVFSNEIYRMISYRHPPQYGSATALAVIVIAIMMALIAAKNIILGNRHYAVVTGKGYRPTIIPLPQIFRWTIFLIFVLYFLLAVVVPVLQIVVSSFFPIFGYYDFNQVTLKNWVNLFSDQRAMSGLRNTVLYAVGAGTAVVVLGGLIAYVRTRTRHWLGFWLELLAWTPWTLPGIVTGLALLWAWALPPAPFNLYGTAAVIVIGFVLKGLPLGTATMQSAIRQISPELEESSRVHGGSWLQTMRHVMSPLLWRGAMATFVIVFVLASRDLTIPLLLYRNGTETRSEERRT